MKVEDLFLLDPLQRIYFFHLFYFETGKLPNETFTKHFDLEYGSTSIEIQKAKITKEGCHIDDLVATGGIAIACAELNRKFCVKIIILILCIIDLPSLGGSDLIIEKG